MFLPFLFSVLSFVESESNSVKTDYSVNMQKCLQRIDRCEWKKKIHEIHRNTIEICQYASKQNVDNKTINYQSWLPINNCVTHKRQRQILKFSKSKTIKPNTNDELKNRLTFGTDKIKQKQKLQKTTEIFKNW